MGTGEWDRTDLVRRVVRTLHLAAAIVGGLAPDGGRPYGGRPYGAHPDGAHPDGAHPGSDLRSPTLLPASKVVNEAAMLLFAAAQVRHLDVGIEAAVVALIERLRPYARTDAVLAGLLLDPGRARDHATVHIILSYLGHRDPEVDDLLRRSVADGALSAPERAPHRELEQHWLARLGSGVGEAGPDSDAIRRSSLGRSLDPLSATPMDAYAFSHAVLYATDFGSRWPEPPRLQADISADAEAALAAALDLDDLDLAAELLWTWPMLALAWTPGATFAFSLLAASTDQDGFLPGPDFDVAVHRALGADRGAGYRQATCYHTTFVMGFLCAAALRAGCAPPAVVPGTIRRGPAPELVELVARATEGGLAPRWLDRWPMLRPAQQNALTNFVVAAALARARNRGDLELTRACLQLASRYDGLLAPAPRQALALLQRASSYRPEPANEGAQLVMV